ALCGEAAPRRRRAVAAPVFGDEHDQCRRQLFRLQTLEGSSGDGVRHNQRTLTVQSFSEQSQVGGGVSMEKPGLAQDASQRTELAHETVAGVLQLGFAALERRLRLLDLAAMGSMLGKVRTAWTRRVVDTPLQRIGATLQHLVPLTRIGGAAS